MKVTNNYLYEQYSHITSSIPLSLHHTVIPPNYNDALYPHWHHELELFYLEQGQLDFIIEDQTLILSAGDSIYIPPHLLHSASQRVNKGCSFRAIVFSPEILTNALQYPEAPNLFNFKHFSGSHNVIHIKPDSESNIEIIGIIKHLCSFYKKDPKESSLEIIGNILILWQKLYNTYLSIAVSGSQSDKLVTQLQTSIYYIQENYNTAISLNELAETCHLSRGYYCKTFKSLYGITPFEFLNRYRIKKACSYLAHTDMTIIEIMYTIGMNNLSYFNRQFKRYMGITPTIYKKSLQERDNSIW